MLRNKRKILASMLAIGLIMQFETAGVFADTKNDSSEKKPIFSDVPEKRWSNDIIESFYNKGIIEGYPDGTFRPKEKITRAEVATIIKKLDLNEVKEPIPFTDVTSDMWYSAAVDNSVKIGLAVGYPDGTFKPEKNITRSEAFKVTAKSYKKADTNDITLDFPDQHTVEPWAEEFQKQLIYYEKLEGYPDQTIRGGKDITREEFIKLIGHIVDEDFDMQGNLNSWQEDYVDSSNNTENTNGENKNPINPVKPINPVTPPNNGGNSNNNDDDTTVVVKKSRIPVINQPFENDTEISGTGIPISTITVTLPNGSKINAIVDNNGTWSISLRTSGYELKADDKIIVVQKESNKTVSDETETTVQARGLFKVSKGSETINHILNDTDNKFILENSKYPNYDKSLYDSNNLVAKEEIEITLYKPNAIKSIGYYFVPLTDNNVYTDKKLPTSQITPITSNKIENDIIVNGRYIIVAENAVGEKEVKEIVIKNKRDGSITHPFRVSNAEDLKTLKNSDKYYEVTKNINLDGISWQPIEGFTGHFYGNDYTISNLSITELSNDKLFEIGLFSSITDGSINNVNLEVKEIDVEFYLQEDEFTFVSIGGLVGNVNADSVISDIDTTIDGKINATSLNNSYGNLSIGGVVGRIFEHNKSDYDVTIERWTVKNTKNSVMNISNEYFAIAEIGGAIGYVYGNYLFSSDHDESMHNINVKDVKVINENCIIKSDILGTTAGAIGTFYNGYISDVVVENNGVTIEGSGSISGGAVGISSYACIENANVLNEDTTINNSTSGGIIGRSERNNLLNFNCINKNNTIEAIFYAGGMIGYASDCKSKDFEVKNIDLNILSGNYSGGIFGCALISDLKKVHIENTNTNIESNQYAGGAIGQISGVTFNDFECVNENSKIVGGFSAGGAISESHTKSSNLIDFKCTNAKTTIEGVYCAGGMIGESGSINLKNIEVANVENTQIKSDGLYSEKTGSGGMIGYVSGLNTINDSDKVFVINNENSITGKLSGGIIGYAASVGIKNFYVENTDTNINGKESAGGAIGKDIVSYISGITAKNTGGVIKTSGDGPLTSGGLIGSISATELLGANVTNVENNICSEGPSNYKMAGGVIGQAVVPRGLSFEVTNGAGTNISSGYSGGGIGAINIMHTDYEISNVTVNNQSGSEINGKTFAGGLFGSLGTSTKTFSFGENININTNGVVKSDGAVGAVIGLIDMTAKINDINKIFLSFEEGIFEGNPKGKYYGNASGVTFNPALLTGENDLYPTESKLLILPEIPKLPELQVTPVFPESPKDEVIIDKEDLGEIEFIEDKEDVEIIDETENTEEIEEIEDTQDEITEETDNGNTVIDTIKEEDIEELQNIDVYIIEEEIL